MYQPIENYAVVGDLNTVALVGLNGSIDFLCFPYFDSPTIFAALLDDKRGGRFVIAPAGGYGRTKQIYLPDSNVLLTRFFCGDGVAEVMDYMPVEESGHQHAVVRRASVIRGEIRFTMLCAPRFDYARGSHQVEQSRNCVRFVSTCRHKVDLCLRSTIPLKVIDGQAHAEFTLHAGRSADFILEKASSRQSPASGQDFVFKNFNETNNFWRSWISRCNYRGRWREMVNRSALALKLLISRKYGSIVAAPTFGLPENIGGERNWDYRYAWIRDSAFTVYCLLQLGYTDEAAAFMKWIHARCTDRCADHGNGPLRIVYRLDGSSGLNEEVLSHLEGYRKSAPVRIGNAAEGQLQLDIYGELMDSVYLYDRYAQPVSYELWNDLTELTDWVCANWRLKDQSIWEVRSPGREFLFSRLMCWVALDRAVRIAVARSLPAPLDKWLAARDEIHREINQHYYNKKRNTFAQYKGGQSTDAALLLMPLVKFVSPVDPRWLSTIRAIEEDLVCDALVHRYKIEGEGTDGLRGDEGTFSLCSFWYVEALARAGQLDKARLCFEKMLSYANHVGLYSEQLGPQGEHLGNFPQALTHLAVISAAFDLERNLNQSSSQMQAYPSQAK